MIFGIFRQFQGKRILKDTCTLKLQFEDDVNLTPKNWFKNITNQHFFVNQQRLILEK